MSALRNVLSCCLLLVGCGSAPDKRDNEPTPIFARTAALTHTCVVRTDRTEFKPRYWSYAGHDSSSTQNATWVTRVESDRVVNFMPTPGSFVVSTLDETGALGEPVAIAATDPKQVAHPTLVAQDDDGFAVLWFENEDPGTGASLHFASFDARGSSRGTAQPIALRGGASARSLRAARGPGGNIALAYNAANQGVHDEARMIVVDAMGAVVTAEQDVAEGSLATPEIVATQQGFAVLHKWSDTEDTRVSLARYDASGNHLPDAAPAVQADSSKLTGGSFAGDALALLALDGGYLAAWHEGSQGNVDLNKPRGGYVVVRLARLDTDGKVVDEALLRASEDSVDEVEPVLLHHGDQVALLWGRGKHIYECGGCVPDQDIELLLIEPSTLTRVSNVVEVTPKSGGLLRKRASLRGGVVMTTFEITYHTSSEPAFAAFACTRDAG